MRRLTSLFVALALIGCQDRAKEEPIDVRADAGEKFQPPPPMPPLIGTLDRKAFGKLLRERSAELITVENSQTMFGMWSGILTITNKTDRTIVGGEHIVQCVVFDDQSRRIGISIPIIPTIDLEPGETFTAQAAAMGLTQGATPAAYECLFQG